MNTTVIAALPASQPATNASPVGFGRSLLHDDRDRRE